MTANPDAADTPEVIPIRVVNNRHRGRMVNATFAIALVAYVIYLFGTSPNINWGAFRTYVFYSTVLDGLVITIWLTVLCMALGIALGIVLALMRISHDPVLRGISGFYVWIWRGTPLLVQLVLMFNLALVIPMVGFGEYTVSMNTIMTPFVAAVLALSLNEAAYMAEIIRGGILSVDEGQMEAAKAQGFTNRQAMRLIVLPQTMAAVLPVTGNQTIGMLKATSLVSVIAAQDLMTAAEHIYQRNFLVIELLFVACFWYLILVSLSSLGQYYLERWVARKRGETPEPDAIRRMLSAFRPGRISTANQGH